MNLLLTTTAPHGWICDATYVTSQGADVATGCNRRSTLTAVSPATAPPRRWILVTVSTTGASSSLRVHAWRKLRSLGGVYLQQSVCILPEREETSRAVRRLADRVR